jgi:hypothetical protein
MYKVVKVYTALLQQPPSVLPFIKSPPPQGYNTKGLGEGGPLVYRHVCVSPSTVHGSPRFAYQMNGTKDSSSVPPLPV